MDLIDAIKGAIRKNQADAMTPQEHLRYKEATGASIDGGVPAPVVQQTNIGGDQAPLDPRATLVGPNGQRFTPEQMQQLQAALRQRQLPPQGSLSTVGLR